MSGKKDGYGERQRCIIHGHGRRLSQAELREIRFAIDVARARVKRAGKKPLDPRITMFSCRCNCFYVDVE